MRSSLYEPAREAALLLLLGCVLGLAYNGLTRRGIFTGAHESGPPTPALSGPAPGFMTYSEAAALFSSGIGVWVDARHEFDYRLGHIKGALNIPLKEFLDRFPVLSTMPKDTLLITYCDGAECNSSVELGARLSAAGFTNVKIFFGGWNEWQAHGQPTER